MLGCNRPPLTLLCWEEWGNTCCWQVDMKVQVLQLVVTENTGEERVTSFCQLKEGVQAFQQVSADGPMDGKEKGGSLCDLH